jgi:hypothetical protein
VVRYHTDVAPLDVPEIHHEVRDAIQANLQAIRRGEVSRVVILAGEPGMGKSHLINHFRDAKRAADSGYVLVCNSNHWKVQEFEEFLLDSLLDALCRPSPDGPHLLLDFVQELARQALGHILQRPGQLRHFTGRKDAGLVHRLWLKMFGDRRARFQQAYEKRDPAVFRWLDFRRFSSYVCDRFLQEPSNPFHRYVLQVLLRYVFPEERETVLHWLRRKNVRNHFLEKLNVEESIDKRFKVIDTIKILISLFTPDVARGLDPTGTENRGKVFFFAFDQIEGRQELFEEDNDWFKFFAQLSELYNALPNVFVMFTMTLGLRDRLYPKMERQFRSRIHRDHKFLLRELTDGEILAVYRRRIQLWLGDALPETRPLLEDARYTYLPFRAEDIVGFCRAKSLRDSLEQMEIRFRKEIDGGVTLDDPRFEYLIAHNELKLEEESTAPFTYTKDHLNNVTELMNRAGGTFAASFGMTLHGIEGLATTDEVPAVRLEFRDRSQPDRWVRVFLVRLPNQYKQKLPGCVNLLYKLQTDRNFLWLVRPERIEISDKKQEQVFARKLEASCETALRAMLRLLGKRDQFKTDTWPKAEQVLLEEFKLTYLGEIFQHVADNLLEVSAVAENAVSADADGRAVS